MTENELISAIETMLKKWLDVDEGPSRQELLQDLYESIDEDGTLVIRDPDDTYEMELAIKSIHGNEDVVVYDEPRLVTPNCKRIILAGKIPARFRKEAFGRRVTYEESS